MSFCRRRADVAKPLDQRNKVSLACLRERETYKTVVEDEVEFVLVSTRRPDGFKKVAEDF
jgi:hypothetical protein